jgi:hypothetical protein
MKRLNKDQMQQVLGGRFSICIVVPCGPLGLFNCNLCWYEPA